MPRAWWVPLLAAALTSAACAPEPGAAPRPRNAVFIVIDTLRTDHLGAYGYARETSPAIDALAAQGPRFERAYATSGWTAPSVASMLTGVAPSAHGVTRPKTPLPDAIPTLPQTLRDAGFATAAVVSNAMLGRRNGFDRGFDWFDERQARGHQAVSTPAVASTAIAVLEQLSAQSKRFFLFVHLFDPHYNYRNHEWIDFAASSEGRLSGGETIHALRGMQPALTRAEIGFLRDLYDEEIRLSDSGVARIVTALRELGQLDHTLIVLTADHGEEFLERGWLGHTRTLHDELVRVPLIVRSPGAASASVVSEPVSLAELPRAFARWLGVQPAQTFGPSSLAAHTGSDGATNSAIPALLEVDFVPVGAHNEAKTSRQQGIVEGRYKLIRDGLSGRTALYDLLADPAEQHDIASQHPERLQRLGAELDRRLATARASAFAATPRELSEDEQRELRALGYGD
jgi:arylsulfatase A-like enzyme